MARKKQCKYAVTGSTRVLRPRKTPAGDAKANDRDTVKVPKASKKLKTEDAGTANIVIKREPEDSEGARSQAKKLKTMHKTQMDGDGERGSTRILRSSIKKEKEAEEAVQVKDKILKFSSSLATDFAGPESSGKSVRGSVSRRRGRKARRKYPWISVSVSLTKKQWEQSSSR
ncbi:hypothetical protein ACET3Z_023625 [Daucus carota]